MTVESGHTRANDLLIKITQSLWNGMPREEFDALKGDVISPGFTVADLIQAECELGTIKWQNDKLVHDLNGIKIDFDEKTEEKLRERSNEMNILPRDLIMLFIKKGLED